MLFAQLVDDPSSLPDEFPTEELQKAERDRLFAIIEDLVKWENSTNEEVLERARAEIRRSCGGVLPPVYDLFSGGGLITLADPEKVLALGYVMNAQGAGLLANPRGQSLIEATYQACVG